MFRSRSTTKRQHGGEKKCLFINWGPGIGLGNQLCIYAAALIIKNKLKNWDLCIPPVEYNPHSSTDYRFLFKQGKAIDKTAEVAQQITRAIVVHKNKNVYHGKWEKNNLVINSGDDFTNTTKNLRMKSTNEPEVGYYHNYASIEPAIEIVRPEIQAELDSRYGSSSPIEDPDSAAFIHIRHGDFSSFNLMPPVEYYRAAKAKLQSTPAIKRLYIISEPSGIEWAKENSLTEGTETIDDSDEVKVLYIMSQCKAGGCISPSTFSIWGAILGPEKDGIVIYPSKWPNTTVEELSFPGKWIQI
jgi:hypothetical protein